MIKTRNQSLVQFLLMLFTLLGTTSSLNQNMVSVLVIETLGATEYSCL